jgi:hypothetical protein
MKRLKAMSRIAPQFRLEQVAKMVKPQVGTLSPVEV